MKIAVAVVRRARELFSACMLLAWTVIPAGAQAVTTTDLGTLGGNSSIANAINVSGQVVGYASTIRDESYHAFLWTEKRGMIDLGTLGYVNSLATAINDNGQVVGTLYNASPRVDRAFFWTAQGGMIDLGTFGGVNSIAVAVNALGQVIGYADTATRDEFGGPIPHAFVWTEQGGLVDLGTLGGTASSQATAINDRGQIVGFSYTNAQVAPRAFSWTSTGGMIDVGTLDGRYSVATAVNADGTIVGYASMGQNTHAFMQPYNGVMRDLGAFPSSNGMSFSQAAAISASGQVVGNSSGEGFTTGAFSWTADTGMVELGRLAGVQRAATAVNNSGLVVGWASTLFEASRHAFAWTIERGMIDLSPGNNIYSFPTGVNARGQVVGSSRNHAVIWYVSSKLTQEYGNDGVAFE